MTIGGAGLVDYVQTTSARAVLISAVPGNDSGLVTLFEAAEEQLRVLEDGVIFRATEDGLLRITEG